MSKSKEVSKYEFAELIDKLSVPSLQYYTEKEYFNEKDLRILKEYYPIGGEALCKEKGIKKSSIAMKVKYQQICKENRDDE